MQPFYERRKHLRVNSSLTLRIKKLYGDTYIDENAITKDLSAAGVRFESGYPITLNSRLLLEIDLPNIKGALRALSRVVWIRKLDTGNNFEFGNDFLSIKKEDAAIISDYTEKLLLRTPYKKPKATIGSQTD